MDKTNRDVACFVLACMLGIFSLVSSLMPRVAAGAGDTSSAPLERASVIEPDSPEIIEQRRLMAERAAEQDRLAAERREFIRVWGERIDAFNEGYPLEGYGETFAKAAYDNGVDPRFAPAIARMESASGRDCFLPYNAWGWHGSEWSDWETAINEYVPQLAEGYGYTLSYAAAEVYNGAHIDLWYETVLGCMTAIWPTDEL